MKEVKAPKTYISELLNPSDYDEMLAGHRDILYRFATSLRTKRLLGGNPPKSVVYWLGRDNDAQYVERPIIKLERGTCPSDPDRPMEYILIHHPPLETAPAVPSNCGESASALKNPFTQEALDRMFMKLSKLVWKDDDDFMRLFR